MRYFLFLSLIACSEAADSDSDVVVDSDAAVSDTDSSDSDVADTDAAADSDAQ